MIESILKIISQLIEEWQDAKTKRKAKAAYKRRKRAINRELRQKDRLEARAKRFPNSKSK